MQSQPIIPDAEPFCPVCNRPVAADATTCANCETPLAGYLRAFVRSRLAYSRAVEAIKQNELSRATREAFLAVSLEPSCFEFRWLLSCLLAESGELDEAIDQAHAAQELSPGTEELKVWLIELFRRRHDAQQIPVTEHGGGE